VPRGDKYVFPDITNAQSALLCVPMPLVPFFRRWFDEMQQRYNWQSREDWFSAYQAFAKMESELMSSCLADLITEQQRLYRLLDTSLNGTQYTVTGDLISPALPAVPTSSANATNALRAHISRIWQLLENDIAGITAGPGESIVGAQALPDGDSVRDVLRRLIAGTTYADPKPADNLLMALRGTVVASTERNVIDDSGTAIVDLIDQVETLLTQIRDSLV
jgi:hypothetical protein